MAGTRHNRRRRRGRFSFLWKLLAALIIVAAMVAAVTLFFRMDYVVVTGNERYTEQEVLDIYREFYAGSAFVRVLPSTAATGTMSVRGTNRCEIVVSVDQRVRKLRIVSIIDNLVKGQAGQALQNMNVMFGLPETAGLDKPGMYP